MTRRSPPVTAVLDGARIRLTGYAQPLTASEARALAGELFRLSHTLAGGRPLDPEVRVATAKVVRKA